MHIQKNTFISCVSLGSVHIVHIFTLSFFPLIAMTHHHSEGDDSSMVLNTRQQETPAQTRTSNTNRGTNKRHRSGATPPAQQQLSQVQQQLIFGQLPKTCSMSHEITFPPIVVKFKY